MSKPASRVHLKSLQDRLLESERWQAANAVRLNEVVQELGRLVLLLGEHRLGAGDTSWAKVRELRDRLSALECILQGAARVARMPKTTTATSDVATSPEEPR